MSTKKPPAREDSYVVFGLRPDTGLDLASWQRHAEQFLDTQIGLLDGDRFDAGFPWLQAMNVMVAPLREGFEPAGGRGVRACWCRQALADDQRVAATAEGAEGTRTGLADLANRCPLLWLVEVRPGVVAGAIDLVALRIAVILAGVELGPILLPGGPLPEGKRLVGPKTARAMLG